MTNLQIQMKTIMERSLSGNGQFRLILQSILECGFRVSSLDQIPPVFPDSRVSRTFWKIFLNKSRENKNGIIFWDHKNFPFLKAIERKAKGRENQSVQHVEYSPYFILFYFWEAQGQT
jgi:hypothetical protein